METNSDHEEPDTSEALYRSKAYGKRSHRLHKRLLVLSNQPLMKYSDCISWELKRSALETDETLALVVYLIDRELPKTYLIIHVTEERLDPVIIK